MGVARPRSHRPGGRSPAVLEPRPAARPRLRRDVLRQAGVLAAALRRRDAGARVAQGAGRRVHRRQPRRLLPRRRRHGRAPAGRQVGHRRGRVAARGGLRVRLALLRGARRHAVDPRRRTRRSPALRLDGARVRGGLPPRVRGVALRHVAHRHPRHLRQLLRAVRVRGAARRPRPQPGDPRREGGGAAARHVARRGRALARVAAVAVGRPGSRWGWRRARSGRACSSSPRSG